MSTGNVDFKLTGSYTVQSGDNFSTIIKENQGSTSVWDEVAEQSGISDVNKINQGQEILFNESMLEAQMIGNFSSYAQELGVEAQGSDLGSYFEALSGAYANGNEEVADFYDSALDSLKELNEYYEDYAGNGDISQEQAYVQELIGYLDTDGYYSLKTSEGAEEVPEEQETVEEQPEEKSFKDMTNSEKDEATALDKEAFKDFGSYEFLGGEDGLLTQYNEAVDKLYTRGATEEDYQNVMNLKANLETIADVMNSKDSTFSFDATVGSPQMKEQRQKANELSKDFDYKQTFVSLMEQGLSAEDAKAALEDSKAMLLDAADAMNNIPDVSDAQELLLKGSKNKAETMQNEIVTDVYNHLNGLNNLLDGNVPSTPTFGENLDSFKEDLNNITTKFENVGIDADTAQKMMKIYDSCKEKGLTDVQWGLGQTPFETLEKTLKQVAKGQTPSNNYQDALKGLENQLKNL